ncbi:MAG: S-layer homology domain-containing protein, partial [Clostridiales bacterium]|nr:S-layer homology domain-containing protein [Clostridiales bacterium]
EDTAGGAAQRQSFRDDFSAYNAANSQYETAVHAERNRPKTLAEGGNYRWLLSGLKYGVNGASGETGYANMGARGLMVGDYWARGTAVNLALDGFVLGEASQYRFTWDSGWLGAGARIFVSPDEEGYYEFGVSRKEYKEPIGKYSATPYVIDRFGSQTYLPDEEWDVVGVYHCDIYVTRDTVIWNIRQGTRSFAGSLPLTASAAANYKYPAAAVCYGDGAAAFTEAELVTGTPYLGIGEPPNALYSDAARDAVISGSAAALAEAKIIRRVIVPALSGDTVKIGLSENGADYRFYTSAFALGGHWLNQRTANLIRAVRLPDGTDVSGLALLTEMRNGEEVSVTVGDSLRLYATADGVWNNPAALWQSGDVKLASVAGGEVRGEREGQTAVTVSTAGGASMSVTVNVKDAITVAEENGTLAEYVASKQAVIGRLNGLLAGGDAAGLGAFLTEAGAGTLSEITFINRDKVTALAEETPGEFDKFLARLLTYPAFVFRAKADLTVLERVLNAEAAMGEICGVTDAEVLEQALARNNAYFEFPLTNQYYSDAKAGVLDAMLNIEFANLAAAKKLFADRYVMLNFNAAETGAYIGRLVKDSAAEIGYDAAAFARKEANANFLPALAERLRRDKDEIDAIDALKDAVDGFPVPEDPKGGGKAGGGSPTGGNTPPSRTFPTETAEGTPAPPQLYHDVPSDHWAYEGIRFLTARKAAEGYGDGLFLPNHEITRAEFLKIIMAGFQMQPSEADETAEEPPGNPFADVAESDWFYPYVTAARQANITRGDERGNFNPAALITREEMAAMLIRVLNAQGLKLSRAEVSVVFTDYEEISDWAFTAVTELQLAGILSGREDGRFDPRANASRAEAAKVIYLAVMRGASE